MSAFQSRTDAAAEDLAKGLVDHTYLPKLLEFATELGNLPPDDLKPFDLARLRDNMAATPGKSTPP